LKHKLTRTEPKDGQPSKMPVYFQKPENALKRAQGTYFVTPRDLGCLGDQNWQTVGIIQEVRNSIYDIPT